MTGTEARPPEAGDDTGAPSRERPWWMYTLGVVALAGLGFVLIKGGTKDPAPKPPAPEFSGGLDIQLPETRHRDVQEEARGVYMLENDQATISLELQREGRFRFLSRMQGKELREALGSWNLVGNRLTMKYETIDGKAIDPPTLVRNVYRIRTIQLRETGLDFPVVLTKRTVIRDR